MMNSGIRCHRVQPSDEIADRIFDLQQQVYGDSEQLEQRWKWEFLSHPRYADVRLYCAEKDGQLIGLTVRHPVMLSFEGSTLPGFFSSHSMVRPDMRGQGIIRDLYMLAAEETGAIQFSKGTAQGMYAVLKNIGYRDIEPNTYQICILDPLRWALQRVLKRPQKNLDDGLRSELELIGDIPDDVSDIRCDGVLKNAEYLNWRYRRIPHKQYAVYLRRVSGKPVSFLVLRYKGNCAYLVDIIWDVQADDEPSATINLAKKEARRKGANKMVAWGTSKKLRSDLSRQGFFNTRETPHFSYFSLKSSADYIAWNDLNFVHGEGDIDYL